ncbi:MAG: hypothetical protein EKK42_05875 [Pseudonocardiaceae bacterium]|nr:MAG: hypothetical protein EKK42_05875 [Pseudonocardiaceae bacterium]
MVEVVAGGARPVDDVGGGPFGLGRPARGGEGVGLHEPGAELEGVGATRTVPGGGPVEVDDRLLGAAREHLQQPGPVLDVRVDVELTGQARERVDVAGGPVEVALQHRHPRRDPQPVPPCRGADVVLVEEQREPAPSFGEVATRQPVVAQGRGELEAGVVLFLREDLAHECGLAVDDGILVDGDLRTSDPAVLAVGDCARFPAGREPAHCPGWPGDITSGSYPPTVSERLVCPWH